MDATSRTRSDDAVVHARGVCRRYGPVEAVRGVDLDIRPGELFGLIGHNGAGKSTLFRMMLGLLRPDAGSLRIDGCETTAPAFRDTRRHIGYLPENVVLYDNLNAEETLRFFARLKRLERPGIGDALARVGLAHAARRPVREFSKGMRQRLGFAQALLGQPRILFLDEPTNGLDPEAIAGFYATLAQLRDQGTTVVLTSHILAEIQQRVDRLAIMASGGIRVCGSVQALREQLDLPLVFHLRVAAQDRAAVTEGLTGLAGVQLEDTPAGLRARCPRAGKMQLLARVGSLSARIQDLTLHEPSLEDVFFGFSD
ncbi:MAG: ABC transporter ATP-binding protein [Methyloversatilis sp.]|uniref:ABC transporter ATP-binding protein n=1 Tax=Methyloversatilis sp. TaxID=2569862 RepID=UPI002735E8A0|nr:ABC transporter ATP-binding protein [Methyloversatilis sp.]MDP3872555.1 ABC transporter ATP-binding protein [Methyloversatilis sp.]